MVSHLDALSAESTSLPMPERTVRLRAVFEHSRNAMLIADDQRHFRDANDAACRLLGAPRGWILNHRIDDVTPAEQRREAVDYSATANIVPGMHLSILLPLVPGLPEPGIPEGESTALTRREAQVMGLIALGSNTEEIAERLAITQETARSHAKNAMRKLGARSRAHAVALALARGELTLS